jgi:hypothetical protein
MLFHSAETAASEPSAWMLPSVNGPPSPSWKAPMTTVTVGTSRKIVTKPKNGSRARYRPTEIRRPVPAVFAAGAVVALS